VRVGVTLPTFHDDPGRVLRLAREAEDTGIDGVFLFDHLWHIGKKAKPALHGPTLLGAVVAATDRIRVGTLVARVGIQRPAVLAAMFTTLARMAPGRVIAGLGVGDGMNREENEAFGLSFAPRAERLAEMVELAAGLRADGIPVWIGGTAVAMWQVAAISADAVNLWNTPVAMTREAVPHVAPAEVTWAGLARAEVADMGLAAHMAAQAEAGAGWSIYAAGSDPAFLTQLADARREVGL